MFFSIANISVSMIVCDFGTVASSVGRDLIIGLSPNFEVIKLEFILRLKIKRNDWLLVDTCPQAANQCALF